MQNGTPRTLLLEIQGCEVVVQSFGTTDLLDAAVGFPKQFRRAEFAVVLEAHRVTVGTGIVNHQQIADLHFRQLSIDRELIVVLTE